MIPILKMSELRHRKGEWIAQGHTGGEGQSWNSHPSGLVSEATPFTTNLPTDNQMRQALFSAHFSEEETDGHTEDKWLSHSLKASV